MNEETLDDAIVSKMYVEESKMIEELLDFIHEFNLDIETIESMPAFKDHLNFLKSD
jgi:molybdenum cofactor biosynthesis enzyme MoaA